MRTNTFDSFDPIPIIGYLSTVKCACDTNVIAEGADMWLLAFFTEKLAAAPLNSQIALLSKSRKHCKYGTVAGYSKYISYLLVEFATCDVIAEIDAEILRFRHPSYMTLTEYAETLWIKGLACHLFMMNTSKREYLL